MISRAVLGVSAGIFAVVALGVAAHIAPPERRGSAIGTILMGTSLSLVIGLPLGTLIGEYMGWRCIFAILGVIYHNNDCSYRKSRSSVIRSRSDFAI